MYDFHVNPVVLVIRALSSSCGMQCWSGLRRGVTTCVSVDCDKEDCEEGVYSDVQATPGSFADPRCLLDAIFRAPTCAGLSSDFVLLGIGPLRACCCQIQIGEGYAPVRLRPMHSCTPCPSMGIIWWRRWYVDTLLRPSGGSMWSMCYARSVCARLHWLVLPYFSSIHDRGTTIRSFSRCTSGPIVRYPSDPGWFSQVWCRRAQTCNGKCYYMVRCMKCHLLQFFNINLSNLFVFYLIGGLRCHRREVGASPQPQGSHTRHIDTWGHQRMPQDCQECHPRPHCVREVST